MNSSDRVAEDGTLSQPQSIRNPGEVEPEQAKTYSTDLNRWLLEAQAQLNTLREIASAVVEVSRFQVIPPAVEAQILALQGFLEGWPSSAAVTVQDPACKALGFVRTGAAQDALAIVAGMTDQGAEQAAHDVDKLLAMLNGRRSVTYFSDIVSRRNSTESQTTNLETGE